MVVGRERGVLRREHVIRARPVDSPSESGEPSSPDPGDPPLRTRGCGARAAFAPAHGTYKPSSSDGVEVVGETGKKVR